MSKKIYCIIISIILILSFFLPVYAASATVNFNTNTTSLKVGETFTITLSVKCPEGINGIANLKYEYDSNILELVKSDVKDSNFISMGTDNSIDLICNTSDKITSSDMYEFVFKVKNNAKLDSTTTITMNKFLLDSDEATNSEVNINAKKIDISIDKNGVVSIKNNAQENQNSSDSGFPFVIVIIAVVVVIGGLLIISNKKAKKSKKTSKNMHSKK